MCRQVANLDASVSMESLLCEEDEGGELPEPEISFGKGITIERADILWGGESESKEKEKKKLTPAEKAELSIENLERETREEEERLSRGFMKSYAQ
ncbi:hypothetical protein HDU82_000968 [Entophlyctis luteolus]|nr:hypothetical protein HDU82_000968 [Entophlyctis luteolus]